MSSIEPTEEQRQAARAWQDGVEQRMSGHPTLALFLAEREAKLREEVTRLETLCTEEARLIVERDTLRARVAELEAKIADGVFSCPGCGRHDFGFFASQIKAACGPCRTRAENAEARVAELEEIAADLRGDIESDVEKHKREVAALKAEIEALQEPPKKHVFWGAGEPDCPAHLKTPRGELHTFACKVCGGSERTPACIHDENQAGRRRDVGVQTMERLCFGAYAREVEAVAAHNAIARHCEDLEAREALHLADIRALATALKIARTWIFSGAPNLSESEAEEIIDEAIARLAHYDDAKAAEGGEG